MGEARFRVKLTQAGWLAGKHKTTILRAIRSGRLSATVGTDGQRRIDVAELERVYGPLRTDARTAAHPVARTPTHPNAPSTDTAALLAELRNHIDRLEADKAELRRDLDAERDERRRLVGIIERAQITDQRPTSTPTPATPRRPRRTSSTPTQPTTPTPAPTPMQQIADTVTSWLRGPLK